VALACPAAAGAVDYAPVDRPGPALDIPADALAASLDCSPGVDGAAKTPVLLLPGTGATPKENYSWTYEPALDKLGIPWCAQTLPEHATADVADNGEYVAYAIRTMFAGSGRKISIIGHSQGGMLPRVALRFWPDTRAMVDDVIAFAPSNHGTKQADGLCASSSCTAADWQQAASSNFIAAVNSGQETFPGISYTNVYTHTDEVVTPNQDDTGSSSLHGGGGSIENVATQDVCPTDVYEHLMIGTIDNVAYELAIDALSHDGPADPSHLSLLTCIAPLMPGINLLTFPQDVLMAVVGFETFSGKDVPAEPPLRCWMLAAGCPAGGSAMPSHTQPHRKAKCRKASKKKSQARGAEARDALRFKSRKPKACKRPAKGKEKRSSHHAARA
jgi:hypothetical protein